MDLKTVFFFGVAKNHFPRTYTSAPLHACAVVCVHMHSYTHTLTRPADIGIGAQRLLQITGQQL